MDILTHALSGALLARATAANNTGPRALSLHARIAAGALAAVFPDVDIVLRPLGTLAYLNLHQGYTHSLVMLPLWAVVLAASFSLATRRRYGWRVFYGVAALGIATHIAGDVITAYGAMLFAPLSDRRYSLPLAFLIDPYFTALIVAALLAAMVFPAQRWITGAGLAALAAYLVWLGLLQRQAVAVGAEYVQRQSLHGARSEALPQPLSPLHRQIIVSDGDRYHMAYVRLHGDPSTRLPWPGVLAEIAHAYTPAASAQWQVRHRFGAAPGEIALALEAWRHPALAGFREFALYPAFDHIAVTSAGTCVWFVDLRFVLPVLAPSFRFGLCRSNTDGAWRLQRIHGDFLID